jgi:hypothetical protein
MLTIPPFKVERRPLAGDPASMTVPVQNNPGPSWLDIGGALQGTAPKQKVHPRFPQLSDKSQKVLLEPPPPLDATETL